MAIGWILGGIFTLMTVLFIAIALMAPELIGIQGKMAKEIEKSHRSPDEEPPKSDSGTNTNKA